MYDIVPGVLQHLREADIVSKAGLAVAAQGQEHCRTGAVRSTNRQGARLNGIVEVGSTSTQEEVSGTDGAKAVESSSAALKRFLVTVEIRDTHAWHFTCTCTPASMVHPSMRLCAHAAALLYCWLARPAAFALAAAPPGGTFEMRVDESAGLARPLSPRGRTGESLPHATAARGALTTSPVPVIPPVNTADSLALLALGDLRAIAKEFELAANGLGKQELIEAIMGAFRQPVAVRRVVSTLEKTQRQFLATFTLAGGFMSDEELRGLFERFGLGRPEHFQQALAKLQSKGLVLRTSFNTSQQLRTNPANLSALGSLNPLEVTWFVPPEVGAALSITLPVTTFRVEEQQEPPVIQHAEPYRLLADLLLVARALEGRAVPREGKRAERRGITGSLMRAAASPSGTPASPSSEGSVAIPPPAGLLPADLLETLQDVVPLAPAFLRFAYRILRLGEILYTDAESSPTANTTSSTGLAAVTVMLRMLPNAAELLLGPTRGDVTVELFAHWLRQATYVELFDLTEAALRLRCRTIAPNQPALRVGELEAENREARLWLISLLAQAPLHQWISFSSFARFVYRLYPTFLQRRQRLFPTPHWWVEQDEGHPLHPTQWSDWSRAEGRYLAQLLQGPLHWWGASDLAFSSDGQLQAFRLTSLAELLFRGPAGVPGQLTSRPGESPVAPAGRVSAMFDGAGALNAQEGLEEQIASTRSAGHLEPVEVAMYDMSGIELSVGARGMERDGEGLDGRPEVLIVSSAGNWPLIDLIERFTRVKGVRAGRLSYQITPASLSEALRRGEDLSTFLELLRCALDAGKNDGSIEEMLGRLERSIANYGRVRLYTGVTLLEVTDTLTLRELAATTSIEQQTIHAIHPTMLVLRKQGREQLIDELKRRGQAPLVHGDE